MRLAAVAASSSVLFLVGCTPTNDASSAEDFKGAEQDVAQKVADLADAGSKRKPADICGGVVSDALRGRIAAGGSSCTEEMRKAIEDVDAFDVKVDDVRITGQKAEADVESKDRDRTVKRTFRFVRENDDWRIDSFG